MKLIILHLKIVNKPCPISEGVIEIRINTQPCKGIHLTTQHMWATEATQVAAVHDAVKESGHVLPLPSVILHTYASVDTPSVAQRLSHHAPVKQGKISSNPSAHEATKNGDSTCPVCVSTFKCLYIRAQLTRALTDTGRGYHLGAPSFRLDHSSSFPSSILSFSLIALPGLQLCQYLNHPAKPHRTSIDRKGPITSGFQPLDFYCLPIQLRIAFYYCISFIGANKVVQ
jgi:hypothetical protein